MNLNENAVIALLICMFTWFFGIVIFLLRNSREVEECCGRFWSRDCSLELLCCYMGDHAEPNVMMV